MTESPLRAEPFQSTSERYEHIVQVLAATMQGEHDCIANLANAAAILWQYMPDVNWVGFYLFNAPDLVLGPFQGKPACLRIRLGQGVCGTAALIRSTVVVPDVDAFEGHIVCDSNARSEIVVPMFQHGNLLAVLDVDSPSLNRFTDDDRTQLERVAAMIVHACHWPQAVPERFESHEGS